MWTTAHQLFWTFFWVPYNHLAHHLGSVVTVVVRILMLAVWMVQHHGPNHRSFLWGQSTHNSWIEWLWVNTGTQFVCAWWAFFVWLKDIHMLNATDSSHHWLLHHLFLGDLNNDCQQFQNDWNHHPISAWGHNQTPLVSISFYMLDFLAHIDVLVGHAVLIWTPPWHLYRVPWVTCYHCLQPKWHCYCWPIQAYQKSCYQHASINCSISLPLCTCHLHTSTSRNLKWRDHPHGLWDCGGRMAR